MYQRDVVACGKKSANHGGTRAPPETLIFAYRMLVSTTIEQISRYTVPSYFSVCVHGFR